MTKPHDADKLTRLRDELVVLLGGTRSTSDAARDAYDECLWHVREAVRLSGTLGWDVKAPPDQLVARLEIDAAAIKRGSREADTLRAIENALVSARAAVTARAKFDRLSAQSARLNQQASDLGTLLRACDKWLEQPEGV